MMLKSTFDWSKNMGFISFWDQVSHMLFNICIFVKDLSKNFGPFIDAERDFGGLPPWLLKNKEIKLRSSDPAYLKPVDEWLKVLFSRLRKFTLKNGGPIIMIHVKFSPLLMCAFSNPWCCSGWEWVWLLRRTNWTFWHWIFDTFERPHQEGNGRWSVFGINRWKFGQND